jgi:AhpD family alkylhydroperoxidase
MSNMQDWNAYRDALLERVGDFAKLSRDVTRGLHTIETSAAKTKHLDPKIHEIIALAVAVTTRCDGCIAVHAKKPVEFGATGKGYFPRCTPHLSAMSGWGSWTGFTSI